MTKVVNRAGTAPAEMNGADEPMKDLEQLPPDLKADFELIARIEAGQLPEAAEAEPEHLPGDGQVLERIPSRRRFFGGFARVGAAVVGGLAGTTLMTKEAAATPCHTYGCCCLAKPPGGCPGSGTTYSCPAGWYRKYWTCVVNGIGYYCGECQSRDQGCSDKRNNNVYHCSEYQRFG